MKQVEGIAEQHERLRQAFDALEAHLQNVNCVSTDAVYIDTSVLEERIKDLTEKNGQLLMKLESATSRYADLRNTCSTSVEKLNSLISTVQSIMEQEGEAGK